MENNNKNKDIIKSSLASPIKEFFIDIAEMGLNEVIEKMYKEERLLREIPFIKWLFVFGEIGGVFQKDFFLQKYSIFIGIINQSFDKEELKNKAYKKKIFTNEKIFSRLIDQTIISLDKYQVTIKAKILGILFVETFKNDKFTIEEYNTLIFSIEFIHPYTGINCLKAFYEYKNYFDQAENEEIKEKIWMENSSLDYSPLANTSLLRLPSGGMYLGNYGGAMINELGYKFYEFVVSKV